MTTRIGALVLIVLLALPVLLTDCGGGGGGGGNPIVVSIAPSTVNLLTGGIHSFTATITGTSNSAANWAVQEGAAGGSITNMGVYTAPNISGTFHVIATSQADTTRSATATVTVVQLTVSPASDVLGPLGVRTFSATANVTWSVQEGAVGGSITSITASGQYTAQYTAPNTTGLFHVVATSVQDSSKNAIANVTIVPSGFRPTGDMSTGRSAHTATLLPNGKVLIAGGDACLFIDYYQFCPLNSAEVYDSGLGKFTTTGSMSVTRVSHTATLLINGKVLVTGGHDASAELYDPTSGTFAATGSMSVGRNSHTATLLANGKVLITGGQAVSGALATAELYDPSSGTFAATTGTMTSQRTSHTATLLANGKVLIAGGSNSAGVVLATAELYDPAAGAAGSFTATTLGMVSPRTFHTATRLSNGNVLVTGGIANIATGVSLSSAEVYDVVAGSFTATAGPMMTVRDSHFAVLLANGSVLVAGGSFGSTGSFTAELYDTVNGTFTQTGGMETGRALAAAVLLLLPDGRVFVSGGSGTISAELYK
jgi:WD40 repeat protein